MQAHDYDLFIIGAGSGGVRAARVAAKHGAKVAIAEESRVGGTCVIRGCVPKKFLVYAASFRDEFADSFGYGWKVSGEEFSWPDLVANKDREIERLSGLYRQSLDRVGATLIESRAEIIDANHIHCDGREIRAQTILIATGSKPELPKLSGIEHAITSNEVFHLPTLPKRVAIVGGGYIALEFAGIFNGLGSEVKVLYRGEEILRGFDDDIRSFLGKALQERGIDIRRKIEIVRIEKNAQGKKLILSDGTNLETDIVLMATGRRPNNFGLGLEKNGVELDELGAVKVNAQSQSTIPNIYAVGDCTNRINLTPVAIREGHAFADSVFGKDPWIVDYADCPSAVFTIPPVGTVGMTEEQAKQNGHAIDIYKAMFRPMRNTLARRKESVLMKLVVDRESDIVLGAHMVGESAPEIIQMLAIAVKLKATKSDLDRTMAIHPTLAEEFVTMAKKEPVPA